MWSLGQSSRTSFVEAQGSQREFSKGQEVETASFLQPEPRNWHNVMSTISIDQAVTDISQFQGRRHEPHFLMGEVARICLHRVVKLGEWGLGKSTTSA